LLTSARIGRWNDSLACVSSKFWILCVLIAYIY
jgi:hypothetical protein